MDNKKALLQWVLGVVLLGVGLWSLAPMLSVTFWSSSTGFIGINGIWENQLMIFSNIFPSLGVWHAQKASDSTQVAFFYSNESVRYQEVEGNSSKNLCDAKSPSEECFVWSMRNWSMLNASAVPPNGNVVILPSEYEFSSARRQRWEMLVHQGATLGGHKTKFVFRGAWDNLSATEGRWMGIGYSTHDARIRRLYSWNNENDTDPYYRLTAKYIRGDLSSMEAVELFNKVYSIAQARQTTSDSSKTGGQDVNKHELTYEDIVDVSCVWLGDIVFSDPNSTVGNMWSTCGDAVSWSTSVQSFRSWTRLTNWYVVGLILLQAIPMLWGCWHQLQWIRNSRTHTLRVSPFQVLLLLYWASFYSKALERFAVYVPLSGKLMSLVEVLSLINQLLLWALFSNTYQEHMHHMHANPNELNNGVFQSLFIIQSGLLTWDLLSDSLTSPWFLGTSLALLWLPQVVHFFTFNGWSGLTTPFILGCSSIGLVPMAMVLGWPPTPWTLPKEVWTGLLLATGVLSMQSTMLTTLRWKTNGYILPNWLAPWRHRYVTPLDTQNAALLENPLCPICRNDLREGWDESDELWRTPCSHFFHKSCLQRWMEESHDCPLCRRFLPDP